MRIAFVTALTCLTAATLNAAPEIAGETLEPSSAPAVAPGATAGNASDRDVRMRWWREAKFGLFIHWGVYAVPAGSYQGTNTYGEWIMHSAKIPSATYKQFAARFNPVKYDPAQWAKTAKDAGMRYIVITSKHHDGFALFPSKASAWNVADATPYKKDLLGPLVEAAHGQGLKIGFYYSQAQDWNNPGGAKSRFQEGEGWDPAHLGSFDAYLAKVAVPQVREILTGYPIDILWWDTPTWMNEKRTAPLAALTALRPGLITNNRLGAGFGGDTATPEQFVPATGFKGDWETCMTLNGHWGYNAADTNWKSSTDLIRKLADICAKGGNFLLNVGPTAEGEFPPACVERLQAMGRWLRVNGEAIYGTVAGPFPRLSYGCATRKGSKLYVHVFDWPKDGSLRVPLRSPVKAAWLLTAPDKKLAVAAGDGRVTVSVPAAAYDADDSVVVLEMDGEPVVAPLPTAGAKATASAAKPGNGPENVLDGTGSKRWLAPADVKSASVEIDLGRPTAIAGFAFDEPDVWPRLRQGFKVEAKAGDTWTELAAGKSDGHGQTRNIAPATAQVFRVTMTSDQGGPGLAEVQLYSPE